MMPLALAYELATGVGDSVQHFTSILTTVIITLLFSLFCFHHSGLCDAEVASFGVNIRYQITISVLGKSDF